jgi:hypothetical protein
MTWRSSNVLAGSGTSLPLEAPGAAASQATEGRVLDHMLAGAVFC